MLDTNKKENEKKINDLVNNYEKDKFEHEKKGDLCQSNDSKHYEFSFFILGTEEFIHI